MTVAISPVRNQIATVASLPRNDNGHSLISMVCDYLSAFIRVHSWLISYENCLVGNGNYGRADGVSSGARGTWSARL